MISAATKRADQDITLPAPTDRTRVKSDNLSDGLKQIWTNKEAGPPRCRDVSKRFRGPI